MDRYASRGLIHKNKAFAPQEPPDRTIKALA
jgi:hypothetical protein